MEKKNTPKILVFKTRHRFDLFYALDISNIRIMHSVTEKRPGYHLDRFFTDTTSPARRKEKP